MADGDLVQLKQAAARVQQLSDANYYVLQSPSQLMAGNAWVGPTARDFESDLNDHLRNLQSALKAIRTLRCGTVNINEVPGFRIESSPFGGIKDSGLGVKEGVIESIKAYSFVKTFSLPW